MPDINIPKEYKVTDKITQPTCSQLLNPLEDGRDRSLVLCISDCKIFFKKEAVLHQLLYVCDTKCRHERQAPEKNLSELLSIEPNHQ